MKNNNVYCYSAIMSALMKFYSIRELAERVTELAQSESDVELEVYNCKSDGFILRRKKDVIISDADVIKCFVKAVKSMIKETGDGIESYIFDQYDFEFDNKMVDSDFASRICDIERNGRLLAIELDL